jgi:hypothetical protein
MPFCRNCGKEITEADKFCPFCGAPSKEQAVPSPPPAAPQQPPPPQQYYQPPPPPPQAQQPPPPQQYYQPPPPPASETNWIIVILGYLLAFLGGVGGIIIGIYLLIRSGTGGKMHGGIILTLSILMLAIIITLL